MDAPAHNSTLPPPLPLGWTEHLGPQGQPYYYNSQTQQSTYVRPLPTFAAPPQPQATPAKKEKPVSKTAIPGTGWMRVTTTQGNTFYTHKAKKLSVWVVPDEIKEAVAAVERREGEEKTAVEAVKQEEARRAVEERQREVERIKFELQSGPKRKAADDIPLEEVVVTKKPKVESDEEEDDDEEEDEEEWQKEAAAQLAAEAEEEQRIRDEEAQREKEELEAQKTRQSMPHLEMPERVELSIEEGKALFKTLLREKEINPLHPWDTALPLFISDPRYVLLPSVSARREAFDEYCRDRARELRQSQVKKEKEDPKAEFERLLREEVKSTRTSWTDFRRAWKKDRRFYGWGRDERDREKRFREFLKELGEEKRLAAQRAEEGFFSLLRQSGIATTDALWKEVKHNIVDDPRYDAVGSSSLREELFNTFLKAQSFKTGSPPQGRGEPSSRLQNSDDETDKARKQKEKKERAVKERENRIRVERQRVEESINKSRMTLSREEGELDFKCATHLIQPCCRCCGAHQRCLPVLELF
ncbi:hypothetical protein OF83DRAFT_1097403 [Amylostereum chailletii]|nr:hypothetical protein OF83DRAFT_1097403 [Amylostereum chailletii]